MKGLVLWLLMALPASSAFADATVGQSAVQEVITQQFEAFRQDDFSRAFDFASPVIKGLFQTPENFGQMVRQGYPMVWRHSGAVFLDFQDIGGRMVQTVEVTDPAGQRFLLGYEMVQTEAGWRINGVALLKAKDVGV